MFILYSRVILDSIFLMLLCLFKTLPARKIIILNEKPYFCSLRTNQQNSLCSNLYSIFVLVSSNQEHNSNWKSHFLRSNRKFCTVYTICKIIYSESNLFSDNYISINEFNILKNFVAKK